MEKDKIVFKGSHPDSLYRVPLGAGAGDGKVARLLRVMRWPVALIVVCVALAIFVYFLMPDNFQTGSDTINATYWESTLAVADTHRARDHQTYRTPAPKKQISEVPPDTRTSEIDFYDADHSKNEELQASISTVTDKQQTKLPIPPVFPTHLTPEVQYGNENADTENMRSPKVLHKINDLPSDSTLKPHITQKPEKPLAIYFKDGEGITTTTTEAASKAMTNNNLYAVYTNKLTNQKVEGLAYKPLLSLIPWPVKNDNFRQQPILPPEMQEFYSQGYARTNFTSGHSKIFGIGIEDVEKMQSTTQSSVYNTRVSPTLPTWRDGDDTTTKNYPVNVNNPDVSQCRSTSQPLCRGVLPYDLAGKPVSFGGVSVSSLLPQIQFVAASNCSARFKTFICALLEPECSPAPHTPKLPCYNLCKAVMDGCESDIPQELRGVLNCRQYSSANCVAARTPCERQEMDCGDGTCIPRDWICDGAHDCPAGEDENICGTCQPHEFRCDSGTCIHKRWTCDGYADCPDGDDESEAKCVGREEPGEESAGSAPAPAVHRPNRVPAPRRSHPAGEDSSKELLMTSDSNHALKRNFTRRPSLSRLTPYSPAMLQATKSKKIDPEDDNDDAKKSSNKIKHDALENKQEVSGDPDEFPVLQEKTPKKDTHKRAEEKPRNQTKTNTRPIDYKNLMKTNPLQGRAPMPRLKPAKFLPTEPAVGEPPAVPTSLDQSINKLERVINGADLMKLISQKAQNTGKEESAESIENSTAYEKTEEQTSFGGRSSAHASPCPDGELRCVDGRCITLAQLCDGTIDCSDHADEDNCYT